MVFLVEKTREEDRVDNTPRPEKYLPDGRKMDLITIALIVSALTYTSTRRYFRLATRRKIRGEGNE